MTVPLEAEEDSLELPIERETPEAMLIERSNWQLIQNAIAELRCITARSCSFAIWKRCAFPENREERSRLLKELSFHVETWSHAGLWYCLIGDVSANDMDNLAKLLKGAGS